MKLIQTEVYFADKPYIRRTFVGPPFPDEQADAVMQERKDEHLQDGWKDVDGRLIKDARVVELSIRDVAVLEGHAST